MRKSSFALARNSLTVKENNVSIKKWNHHRLNQRTGLSESNVVLRKWLSSGSNQMKSIQSPNFAILRPACCSKTTTITVIGSSQFQSSFLWQPPIRTKLVGGPHPYHLKAGYTKSVEPFWKLDVGIRRCQLLL